MSDKVRTELDEIRDLGAMERRHNDEVDRFLQSKPSGETVVLTPEQVKARKQRNFWIALAVGGFMALVFAITLAQMNAYSIAGAAQ